MPFKAINDRHYVCGTRPDGGSSARANMLSLRIDVFDEHMGMLSRNDKLRWGGRRCTGSNIPIAGQIDFPVGTATLEAPLAQRHAAG